MKRLDEIFDISYGSQLDLNKCERCQRPNGYNFVNRSSENCGVSARILEVPRKSPFPAGSITSAMGGSVLSSFVQPEDFYTGQNVKVLIPKTNMTLVVKLYYCGCIEANRFRFSTFGREANASFDSLLVPSPEEVPEKIKKRKMGNPLTTASASPTPLVLDTRRWKLFQIGGETGLFNVCAGKYHYASEYDTGSTPYLGATAMNNSIGKYIDLAPEFDGNTITTGKVNCTTFYQPKAFCATSDVNILTPKDFVLNKYIGVFLAALINFSEGYKWDYGRQCRVNDTERIRIRLPVTQEGKPDWEWMENYIKGLPFSAAL